MFGSIFKSYKVMSIFGVPVSIHGTVLALLAFFGIQSLITDGLGAGLSLAFQIGMIMLFVILHELGHIFAAKSFGVGTTGLTLYPIGGIARLTRESQTPFEEFVVAVAGPAVNIVLAALGMIAWLLLPVASGVFGFVIVANFALAIFNLIPAYPMDGGRVLRAILWAYVGNAKAIRWAARVGQGFAAIFVAFGLVNGPVTLFLIGLFLFFQTSAEYRRATAMEQFEWHQNQQGTVFLDRFYEAPLQSQPFHSMGFGSQSEQPVVIRKTDSGRFIFVQNDSRPGFN